MTKTQIDKPKILVIIPAYNEEAAISPLIERIRTLHPEIDLLIVNDGSSDRTVERVESCTLSGRKTVVSNAFNLGIGGTMQTGFQIAAIERYDVAVQLDGDGQHDPESLSDLLHPILTDQCDIVVGSRFLSTSYGYRSTFFRRLGITFFSWILRAFTGVNISDPTSGYRAVNKNLINHFAEYYPCDFPEPEALKMANRLGMRILEIPVKMKERQGGVSSIRSWASAYYMIKVTGAILIDLLKPKSKNKYP